MRSSRRLYSDAALESWLWKFSKDWERYFSDDELRRGRNLYRSGGILEIELDERDAIIHIKSGKLPMYVVIDWDGIRPNVRFSHDDDSFGRAIGVAGLYEIEELVGDEVSPLPCDPKEVIEVEEPVDTQDANTQDVEIVDEVIPDHKLIISFYLYRGTLAFNPFWIKPDGSRQLAMGLGSIPGGDVGVCNREHLIRLSSLARRSDFKFNKGHSCYLLDEISSIPLFLSKDWRIWKDLFQLETDSEVALMFKGNQRLETSAEIQKSEKGITVKWNILQDGVKLNDKERFSILKADGDMRFLQGRGLVTLEKNKTDNLKVWQERLDHEFKKGVPPYMLFSLFEQEFAKVDISRELTQWQEGFFKKPKSLPKEPAILRDYQRHGLRWLAHICDRDTHAMLADEMGLGKTLQILSLLKTRPIKDKPQLIVCPASVIPVWQHEAKRFFPGMSMRVVGKNDNFVMSRGPHIWLCSYTQLRRHKHLLNDSEFGYCILDEAQFIKNPAAKVTQACMLIQAAHRIVLTGTPIENKYLDLWTLFRFLMPGLLGTRAKFEKKLLEDGDQFPARLSRQIAPFLLRRLKSDVENDLPEKVEVELMCPMSDLQRQRYDHLVKTGIDKFGEAWESGKKGENMNILTLFTRLRQVSCDPALLPGDEPGVEQSGKLSVLNDRLCELLQGKHRIVVFSQFVKLLKRVRVMIKQSSPDLSLFELTGKTRDRGKPVEQFQNSKDSALMLVSLKAGGTGITLHAADYVFLLDPWWNPAVEAQAIDRVHRIGQTKKVFVYRMIARGSIEEKIQQLKSKKMDISNVVLEDLPKLSELKQEFTNISEFVSLS